MRSDGGSDDGVTDGRMLLIPGGEARAFSVRAGEFVVISDVEGAQVADFIAFRQHSMNEYMSTAHTRAMNGRMSPNIGDIFYSNYRQQMFHLVEDTVGTHDTLFPCCDPMRYELDFGVIGHRNCRDNFVEAFATYGIDYAHVPDPFNIFQNTPLAADGSFGQALEPSSKAGDYIVLLALCDAVVGVSACPQDLTPLCGGKVTDIRVDIRMDGGTDSVLTHTSGQPN